MKNKLLKISQSQSQATLTTAMGTATMT